MKRTSIMLAGGGVVFAVGALAITGPLWIQPASPAATRSAGPVATAEITRGTLVDTKTVTGTLGYGDLNTVRPSLRGASAMVTWIASVGTIVHRGEPLYRLDGQPTILFYGPAPQHRTLRFEPGTAAPVWVELEQAETAMQSGELALNLDQARLDDAEVRVADANARLSDALSPTPATAEFVQLAGAVSGANAKLVRVRELAAAQLTPSVQVALAEAELDTARASFDAAVRALRKDLANARLDAATARVAVADAKVKLDELRTTHTALSAQAPDDTDVRQIADNLAALGYKGTLFEEVLAWQHDAGLPVTGIVRPADLVVAPGPVHIAAHKTSIGGTLAVASSSDGSVLDYSATDRLVTVPLNVGDQNLAAVDRPVTITLPDDRKLRGSISKIGSVVTNDTIDVTVTIDDQAALGSLQVASVDVDFASSGRDDVLSVPVTALLAQPDGGFAVEVVADGVSRLVPVDTGLFAAGRVEVAGDGITEGQRVGVPR